MAHRRRTRSGRPATPRRRLKGEEGYVLVLTALLLLPLLAVTGLAVDLGAWYARAAAIQRAADAAALAGVVYLPDVGAATTRAQEIAAANGFTDGASNGEISVDVTQISGDDAKLQVTITDAKADQFFSTVFTRNVDISRSSTAEYIRPVPMGSPKNFLGTGSLLTGANRENFWLAMSGGCSSKEQGDLIATKTDANYSSSANPPSNSNWASCTGGNTVTNTNYSADGYFYAVEFPRAITGNVAIEIYDPAYCNGSVPGDDSGRSTFTTTFTMRSNNSFNPRAASVLQSTAYTASNCGATQDRWNTLYTITNPTASTYFIQVQTPAGTDQSEMGSNGFALRARVGSTFTPCSSVSSDTGYLANCPKVYGVDDMGVYANLEGTTPSFFLAEIGPEHNNKTMQISLWDPGEGARQIEVLNPLGNPVSFTWNVLCQNGTAPPCSNETAPSGGYGPSTTSMLSLGAGNTNYAQPGPYRLSTSKYSDRRLVLSVQLPTDINAAYGGLKWWRIRYTIDTSSSTDRTTWSVSVKGDPVRLVPNP